MRVQVPPRSPIYNPASLAGFFCLAESKKYYFLSSFGESSTEVALKITDSQSHKADKTIHQETNTFFGKALVIQLAKL